MKQQNEAAEAAEAADPFITLTLTLILYLRIM